MQGIESSSMEVLRVVEGDGDWYYSIMPSQINYLVGQVLTQLEAMGLNESQLRANKAVFNRIVYGWFEEVKDNCRKSSLEETKPFEVIRSADGFEVKNVNGKRIKWEAWSARLTDKEREQTK